LREKLWSFQFESEFVQVLYNTTMKMMWMSMMTQQAGKVNHIGVKGTKSQRLVSSQEGYCYIKMKNGD